MTSYNGISAHTLANEYHHQRREIILDESGDVECSSLARTYCHHINYYVKVKRRRHATLVIGWAQVDRYGACLGAAPACNQSHKQDVTNVGVPV